MKRWLLILVILFPSVLAAQTTVTLNGSTYSTVTTHPWTLGGTSGSLALSLQDTSSTGKANSSNIPYAKILSATNAFISAGYSTTGLLSPAVNPNLAGPGGTCLNAALAWWAQGANPSDPNGYLALAKACIDRAEEYADGANGCDNTLNNCGRSDSNDAVWVPQNMYKLAMTFDIIHSQLSGGEITAFANKVLNDNDAAHGGIDTVACTPQPQTLESGTLTVTQGSATVTGASTSFTSYAAAGGVLIAPYGTGGSSSLPAVIGFISSAGSNTSITLTAPAQFNYNTSLGSGFGTFYYSPPWNANCGMIWYYKHMQPAPLLTPTQGTYYNSANANSTQGPQSNLTYALEVSIASMGLVLAGDDPRAQTLLTQAYNYFLTQEQNFGLTSYMGPPEEGAGYPHEVQSLYTALWVAMVQNAVPTSPAIGGTLAKRWAQEFYLVPFPYNPITQLAYGTTYNSRYNQFSQGPGLFGPVASYLLSGTNEGDYLNYFMMQTTANGGRGDYINSGDLVCCNGEYSTLPFLYAPNQTKTALQTDYRTLPTQFIFNQSDSATCSSLGLQCTQGYSYTCGPSFLPFACKIVPPIYTDMLSKSDWTSTATEVFTNAGWAEVGFDHISAINPGNIHIYRNAPLLAGDGSCNDGASADACDNGNGLSDSVIMLGTFNVNNFGGYLGVTNDSYADVTRWAGTEPTGDSSSRYAYEMIDLTQAYVSSTSPTRVQRHIVHFKKASTQDYVVVYDDIATGTAEPIYIFNHYFVGNGEATDSNTTSTVTLTRSGTARLLTTFLPVGSGTFFLTNEGTSYPGNQGFNNTSRVNICASSSGFACNNSATSMEAITVHLPSTNTSATMPTLSQPSCTATGGNCAAVQIADSGGPKVAVFARQGVTETGMAFTTTHSGTAQYLITGLTPGTYAVTVASTPVSGSPFTVNASDNTLYFESAAGAVQVGASSSPPPGVAPQLFY